MTPEAKPAMAGRQAAEWQIVDYGESVGMVLQQGDDELAVLDTKLTYAKASRLRDLHNAAMAGRQAAEDQALDNAIAALGQGQKGTARQFLRSAIDAAAKLPKAFDERQGTPDPAPTPDCKCIEQGYPEQDCKWHGEAAQHATTPDVEQIARELAKDVCAVLGFEDWRTRSESILHLIRPPLAQARKPLVQALAQIRAGLQKYYDGKQDAAETIDDIGAAALTGTEEK